MSDDTPVTYSAPTIEPERSVPVAEFVQALSLRDKRVELVNAFLHAERKAGRNHDTESAFERRFAAFANLPA